MILALEIVSTYRGEIEMKVSKIYTTIDAHVAGEPLRIITGGVPEIKGETQTGKTRLLHGTFGLPS